jgi:hypothetical protein
VKKNRPKCSPNHFFHKINREFFSVDKRVTYIWATCKIFNKVLELTNCPIGKNSPNLVTLSFSIYNPLFFASKEWIIPFGNYLTTHTEF